MDASVGVADADETPTKVSEPINGHRLKIANLPHVFTPKQMRYFVVKRFRLVNAKKIELVQLQECIVGFASFDSRIECAKAIDVMNKAKFKGKLLTVRTFFCSNNCCTFQVCKAPKERLRFHSGFRSTTLAGGSTLPLPTHADVLVNVQPLAVVDFTAQLNSDDSRQDPGAFMVCRLLSSSFFSTACCVIIMFLST